MPPRHAILAPGLVREKIRRNVLLEFKKPVLLEHIKRVRTLCLLCYRDCTLRLWKPEGAK